MELFTRVYSVKKKRYQVIFPYSCMVREWAQGYLSTILLHAQTQVPHYYPWCTTNTVMNLIPWNHASFYTLS